ncbi:unnamed protein product, partial [Prorocentrum cordatum]
MAPGAASGLNPNLSWQQGGDVLASLDAGREGEGPGDGEVLPARLSYAQLRSGALRLAAALAVRLAADAGGAPEGAVLATRMRRGNEWYCLFMAASKLWVPLAGMSVDLSDKAAEEARNARILAELRPALLVSSRGCDMGAEVSFGQLWSEGAGIVAELAVAGWTKQGAPGAGLASSAASATLCYCFTGGTTGTSRCVRATHAMALHEV